MDFFIIKGIAFFGFLIATLFSFLRYRKLRVTNLWLLLSLSLLMFTFNMGLLFATSIEHSLKSLDLLRTLFMLTGTAFWFSAMISYQKEREMLDNGLDNNLKKRDGKRFNDLEKWKKTI